MRINALTLGLEMQMRVLAIEDDASIAEAIRLGLATAGIDCDIAEHGKKGLEISKLNKPTYDLVMLDLLLPDMHGYDVLKELKAAKVTTPVLILSAMAEVKQKIEGLDLGADDYLTKPFSTAELIARVNAIVRRSKGHAESVLKVDGLCVNLDTRSVEIDGVIVRLTPKEYAVLELFAIHKDVVLSKEMFAEHLYRDITDGYDIKIIDVFVYLFTTVRMMQQYM